MDISTFVDPNSIVFKILIALFLGAFIGLRREIDIQQENTSGFAGFRTMPLIVLLGTISTLFDSMPYLPVIFVIGVLVFLWIAYYNGVFNYHLIGLTSEFAILLMFLAGIFVGYGEFVVAILLTVIIGLFTGFKHLFHSFAKSISPKEWSGALQLLILSVVVLPFLPREPVDSWGVLVPFDIWLLVIFVTSISFVGYFLNKYLGSKSIIMTSVLGSLISSTAVTIALASQSKKHKKVSTNLFVLAILASVGMMLARTIFAILVVATPDMKVIALIPAAMLGVTLVLSLVSAQTVRKEKTKVISIDKELTSPFELLPAIKFAGLFIIVLLGVAIGKAYFGTYGVLATAALSAFVDVDAALLSALQAVRLDEITPDIASLAITLAIVINTMIKIVYVAIIGRRDVAFGSTTSIMFISVIGFISYMLL